MVEDVEVMVVEVVEVVEVAVEVEEVVEEVEEEEVIGGGGGSGPERVAVGRRVFKRDAEHLQQLPYREDVPQVRAPRDRGAAGGRRRASAVSALAPLLHRHRAWRSKGGASSTLGRPEAGYWGHGKLPRRRGGAPGCVGEPRAFRSSWEAEGALSSDRATGDFSQPPCPPCP